MKQMSPAERSRSRQHRNMSFKIRSGGDRTNQKVILAYVSLPKWNHGTICPEMASNTCLFGSCQGVEDSASRKRNADVSPISKAVVYYIYSINSLIGKFGTNDVNTAGTFSI